MSTFLNIFQRDRNSSVKRCVSFQGLCLALLMLAFVSSHFAMAAPSPLPIRVNQLGYYPNSTKYAFIETDQPLENVLGDGDFYFAVLYDAPGANREVYKSTKLNAKRLANFEGGGCDTPCINSRTGTYLYQWDFSPATYQHDKLKVVIRRAGYAAGMQPSTVMTSPEFAIGWNKMFDNYVKVANSAFKYYYFHRIGEATTTQYLTAGEGFSPAHAHAAFHVDAKNKPEGVPCFGDWCGNDVMEPATDIKVGAGTAWADAGDFGVYPVNHAMAAWQLLNLVEFPTQSWFISAAIPQGPSGWFEKVDPTDTAGLMRRYLIASEVEAGSQFMLDFSKLPGLYPHKIHNQSWGEGFAKWTPQLEIDVVPAKDRSSGGGNSDYIKRSATQPSTAATWAVCRTAFHLARVTKNFGRNSYLSWLATGQTAWSRASKDNKVLYPSAYANNAQNKLSIGGGPYGDSNITDDEYACMVEAYLAWYAIDKRSPNFTAARNAVIGNGHYKAADLKFDWQNVRTQANMSLLVAANDLPNADIEQIKRNIESQARSAYARVVAAQTTGWEDDGKPAIRFANYGNPMAHQVEQWGSNASLLNMGVLLSYAARYQHANSQYSSEQYAKAALKTLDYIFGENAQNISFVTGYGKYAEEDTHDRIAWWAKNIHNTKAPYPKGWLAGGPMGNWASCLAGDETKWNGDRSHEKGSVFWKDASGRPYNLDDAWMDGFRNKAGAIKSGETLTAELSNLVLRGSAPSTSFYPINQGSTIPSLKVYGAIGTSADAWCTKENTVNYNSALLWMSVAGAKLLRWQID